MDRKKCLVANIIEFLTQEITDSNLSEEKKESVEVAIQCLETAYEVSPEIREKVEKVDLLAKIPFEVEVSEENKQKAEVHKALGNNAMKAGNFQQAVDEYTMAINCNPKNAIYYCNRAAAFSRLDKQYEAIIDCKQAIKLDPNYGKAYGRLGIAYSNLKLYADAKQAYTAALKLDPSNQMYEANMKLTEERLAELQGSQATPSAGSGGDGGDGDGGGNNLSIFNNEAFLNMAREMMSHPEFYELVHGILQSPGNNFGNWVQLLRGQDMASVLDNRDPNLGENVMRAFESYVRQNPDGGQSEPENKNDDTSNA